MPSLCNALRLSVYSIIRLVIRHQTIWQGIARANSVPEDVDCAAKIVMHIVHIHVYSTEFELFHRDSERQSPFWSWNNWVTVHFLEFCWFPLSFWESKDCWPYSNCFCKNFEHWWSSTHVKFYTCFFSFSNQCQSWISTSMHALKLGTCRGSTCVYCTIFIGIIWCTLEPLIYSILDWNLLNKKRISLWVLWEQMLTEMFALIGSRYANVVRLT